MGIVYWIEAQCHGPVSATNYTSAIIIENILQEDECKKYEEIANEADMSVSLVFRITTKNLQRRKVSVKWVSHLLKEEQKANHRRKFSNQQSKVKLLIMT